MKKSCQNCFKTFLYFKVLFLPCIWKSKNHRKFNTLTWRLSVSFRHMSLNFQIIFSVVQRGLPKKQNLILKYVSGSKFWNWNSKLFILFSFLFVNIWSDYFFYCIFYWFGSLHISCFLQNLNIPTVGTQL